MAGTTSDEAAAKAGPIGSIEALFIAHESALLLYARRLVNQEETAQDIVQEAFLKLHSSFDQVRHPQAWLYRTIHNLAMNHLRAGRKVVPFEKENGDRSDISDTQPLPDEQIERMEAIGQARLVLNALDARSRELIRLKFEEGLSYKQISERAHLSMSNVGYLLHHALKDLAAELKKVGVMS